MTSQPPGEITANRVQRISWTILILVTLCICYFSQLGVIGFVGPDEPRYAWIARDMAETGDWVTPRLYGTPWFEKPVLYYWGAALSFKLFGVSEAAARLPSAVSALFATLALAWLAWRTYGEECARWLLLLLPTSVGMIGFSHAATTDMPFAGMLTIAMVCAAVTLGLLRDENTPILPRTPWVASLLFGFFLGLAVLAKGPAALILCGSAVFFWAVFTKLWRQALRLLHPAGIASFCLTALPWYILCALRNPDFLRIFIIEHNFKRYLTPEFQHVQPFWFYVVVLLIAFLPWSAALLASTWLGAQRIQRTRQAAGLTCLLLCWSVFCLLFFTISKSKLPGYILPAVPAIGLLMVRVFQTGMKANSRLTAYVCFSGVAVFAAAAGAISVASAKFMRHSHIDGRFATVPAIVLLLFALANFIIALAAIRRRMQFYTAAGMVVPLLIAMLSMGWLMPRIFPLGYSGKTLAQEILSSGVPPSQISTHGINRGMRYGLNFYLTQEIPEWDGAHPKNGFLLLGAAENCNSVADDSATCEEPPIHLERSRRFLYRVKPKDSPGRTGGGREPL
jgi:4-amino-4-deoxy-L-arabinose transferase-like glycosyltransferase